MRCYYVSLIIHILLSQSPIRAASCKTEKLHQSTKDSAPALHDLETQVIDIQRRYIIQITPSFKISSRLQLLFSIHSTTTSSKRPIHLHLSSQIPETVSSASFSHSSYRHQVSLFYQSTLVVAYLRCPMCHRFR